MGLLWAEAADPMVEFAHLTVQEALAAGVQYPCAIPGRR